MKKKYKKYNIFQLYLAVIKYSREKIDCFTPLISIQDRG